MLSGYKIQFDVCYLWAKSSLSGVNDVTNSHNDIFYANRKKYPNWLFHDIERVN